MAISCFFSKWRPSAILDSDVRNLAYIPLTVTIDTAYCATAHPRDDEETYRHQTDHLSKPHVKFDDSQ